MNELLALTLIQLTEAIKSRKTSPVELMEAVLSRIDETNPELNAVVAMRDREALMADASEAEKRVMRGEARPLEGIPFGVKDLEDAEGLVTSMGSVPFRDAVAERDSDQVSRLRAAGAILLGKTNAPEFGYTAITKNLVYGVTRSPWNLERTPGGSSGGSSAALSACMLPLVPVSDGGGSVRTPASFTGACGLRPSFGRISLGPSKPASDGDTLDVTIESDATNSFSGGETTRGTFSQISAITSQWLTPVAGAITDTWWRIRYVIAGSSPSYEFIATIGIK